MKIVWTQTAWEDYLYWQKRDQKIFAAVNELIKDIEQNPFKGALLLPVLAGATATASVRLVPAVIVWQMDLHRPSYACDRVSWPNPRK